MEFDFVPTNMERQAIGQSSLLFQMLLDDDDDAMEEFFGTLDRDMGVPIMSSLLSMYILVARVIGVPSEIAAKTAALTIRAMDDFEEDE